MLWHQHENIELACHAYPQAKHLVGDHVAFVKTFHARNVRFQVCDWHSSLCPRHHGHSQVAGEQDAADRVIKLKIAFGMQEVRRNQPYFTVAQGQATAIVGNANHAVFGFPHLGEMGNKTLPYTRDHKRRRSAGQPPVQRSNDVRIGMGSQQIRQLLRRKVLGHAQVQLVVGQVAARIDDGARAVVNDQELVCLHRLAVLFNKVGEHVAGMLGITVKLNGHVDIRRSGRGETVTEHCFC